MDSGTSAIIGTLIGGAIGVVGTLGSAVLKHYLETKREVALDRVRKERLTQMLSGANYVWRSMENLASAIGADEETTAALLLEIGARQSMAKGRNNWALTSRAPFPDDLQQN
jgi:hypothetical protein